MLEPINLLRFSKYGFLISLSALLSFIAASNSTARMFLIYLMGAATFLSVFAFFMRSTELDEEGRARYILKDSQRFEILAIVMMFLLGMIAGLS